MGKGYSPSQAHQFFPDNTLNHRTHHQSFIKEKEINVNKTIMKAIHPLLIYSHHSQSKLAA
jgi:hypothetical protein